LVPCAVLPHPQAIDQPNKTQCREQEMLSNKRFSTILVVLFAFSTNACSLQTPTEASTALIAAPSGTQTVSQGHFSGRSDHITTGKVSLVKSTEGYHLRFAADFSLDGAPDPIVAFGNNDIYFRANKVGELKHKTGDQSYDLPVDFMPGQFSQVYIWCEKFDVPLGIAELSGS